MYLYRICIWHVYINMNIIIIMYIYIESILNICGFWYLAVKVGGRRAAGDRIPRA